MRRLAFAVVSVDNIIRRKIHRGEREPEIWLVAQLLPDRAFVVERDHARRNGVLVRVAP